MAKTTIKSKVLAAAEELRTAQSHAALAAWAKANGADSPSGFANFKKALAEIGLDYDAMRAGARAEQAAAPSARATKSVTLYSDAKARTNRFGICDAAGQPLWHGIFFDNEGVDEQSVAEMAAAKKAVWLASKIAEAAGETSIRLTLIVDAEWLCWANSADPARGGKAKALAEAAHKAHVILTVEHIAGIDNPADEWTVAKGFKKWSDNDLKSLAI